jgi:hypothetical protein
MQREPASDNARHRDRQRTAYRNPVGKVLRAHRRRPAAGRIEPVRSLRLGVLIKHERVTAERAGLWQSDGQHRGGGNRRIDNRAARGENRVAGIGRFRMAGDDHPLRCNYGRATSHRNVLSG